MDFDGFVELLKTAAGHAFTGFIGGFLGSLTYSTGDMKAAFLIAGFNGFVGAGKAFFAYLEENAPKRTAGIGINGHTVAAKYFV